VYITNTTVGNPLFVSPSGNDFHIQSTSPARGAGINLYSTLSALPGGKFDYEGKTYPSSGAWDIGPLQYGSGSTSGGGGGGGGGGTTPPAPPTGLTAVAK
ncbi:MAG TPA: hypothetical protein VJS37_00130, partial [Terriglobales bacterium]|nr:hypothetical protein [Terriglobales bacterium]